jgi:hypothetical protein
MGNIGTAVIIYNDKFEKLHRPTNKFERILSKCTMLLQI